MSVRENGETVVHMRDRDLVFRWKGKMCVGDMRDWINNDTSEGVEKNFHVVRAVEWYIKLSMV